MSDDVIEVIAKTEFAFDGRANTSQSVVLAERIPTWAYGSGVLEVLLFSQSDLTSTADAFFQVFNQSDEPDDPASVFTSSSPSATVIIDNTTATPSLLPALLTGGIGAMVRVHLRWSQGSTPAVDQPQKITVAVNLVMRLGA
jgi:hypothetical protein